MIKLHSNSNLCKVANRDAIAGFVFLMAFSFIANGGETPFEYESSKIDPEEMHAYQISTNPDKFRPRFTDRGNLIS